jgi:7-cyano-7-deazaguanine synthase in queuosine biosynthesis
MSRRKLPVNVVATMRLPRDPQKSLKLDLSALTWTAYGIVEIGRANPAVLDLLEIARTVHEFDRRQPKRTTGVRVKQVRVTMPLREPARWTSAAKNELSAVLRVQGNAEWIFDFTKRTAGKTSADLVFGGSGVEKTKPKKRTKERPPFENVVLFSGGLDSTSGLATLTEQADRTLLIAYYARNRMKQVSIAEKMGFRRLVQIGSRWTVSEAAARIGGQFMYRSFLFLALALLFADATRARSLLQFENGPLALAVEPLDLYRITRHAHPLVHRHLASLFKILTGREINVTNPFLDKTKGEAVALLKSRLAKDLFRDIVAQTETCWYLNSKTIVAGRPRKENGEPCGACVPCLVRRAALGADDTAAAIDFSNGGGRAARDPVIRVHYDSYTAFAERLLDKNFDVHDFMEAVPAATRMALGTGGEMTPADAFALYRRFAREWTRTYA